MSQFATSIFEVANTTKPMAKASKALIIPDELVMNKIYLIRGQKVMLDKDLALLYDMQPIRLREQVKRNINRFPENFMFQLSEKEAGLMVSQNAIPSRKHLGGSFPYVFTEHGVLMLANILKSERAMLVSIRVIEIFVKMRELLLTHKDILLQLEKMEKKLTGHDEDIALIFQYLKQLLNPPQPPRNKVGFRRKDEKE
jgi:phage regulator Rha-like protein